MQRTFEIERNTKETQISMSINLDDGSVVKIETGIGFFDHMLTLLAVHSGIGMVIKAKGDYEVDAHHIVEDVGIVIGKCIAGALADRKGIQRYADTMLPMDEALCHCAIDISNRPYLVFNAKLDGKCGEFDTELVEEFFRAISINGGITLHINLQYGSNRHHIAESIFKAFAKSLGKAIKIVSDTIPSSKGIL